MPMDRSRYPKDWDTIAFQVKERSNWTCQECGRKCRRQGEGLYEFIDRLVGGNWRDNGELCSEIGDHPQRWTLTVAHLNQNPADCSDSNLRALCAPCHLRYDAPYRAANSRQKKERQGQLQLEGI